MAASKKFDGMDIDMLQGEIHIFETHTDMDGIYSFCGWLAWEEYYLYVMKYFQEIGIMWSFDCNDIKTLTDCVLISFHYFV